MLATMASITSATRLKRHAYEFGVYSSVIQTPQIIAREGCGYSLRFDDSAKNIILNAAGELGVKIRSFYYESESEGKKTYSKVVE